MSIQSRAAFASLLGMLLALIIIGWLCYLLLNTLSSRASLNQETNETLSNQNIDSSTPQTLLDSTRSKIDEVNQQLLDRQKQMEAMY